MKHARIRRPGRVHPAARRPTISYNDWPLYYYAEDSEPGDTNGQGIGDIWFVVGADGQLVRDAASA